MDHPQTMDKNAMNAATIDTQAQIWAKHLEDCEANKSGGSRNLARQKIARKTGVPAGTFENLRRGRTKGIRSWMFERLRAAMIDQLESEIRRATHELEVARAAGNSNCEIKMERLAAQIAKSQQLIAQSEIGRPSRAYAREGTKPTVGEFQ